MLTTLVKDFIPLLCICLACSEAETNLALGKPATSSSTYDASTVPGAANDGSPNLVYPQGSCFASNGNDGDPWWQVDLQARVFVTKVKVTARSDCCPDRLHTFALDVFTTDPSLDPPPRTRRCYFYEGSATFGETVTVNCVRPVSGRFLRISKMVRWHGSDLLQFCELQVFGETKPVTYESCSTFTMYPGKRLSTTAVERIGNLTRAECAVQCERDVECWGFNLQYNPNVTCQLVLNPDVAPVADASWDTYMLNPCLNICE